MLTVFGNRDDDSLLCEELGIKWCTRFKLLGIWFDQTLDDMMINYDKAKKKVKDVANSWRNRYVSVYGKVCVVKTLMLPKLTHIATVLPTLPTKQIKEMEKIWHDYITPKKGAARADIKTIHAPTAHGGLGLHHLKEFWQALKVSWIKRLETSKSFWVQILALRASIKCNVLQVTKNLTLDNINRCKNSGNPFWCETFKTFKIVKDNFLAENPDHRLLQLINGNNQLTLDGRSANFSSMENKTIASTINPDSTMMSINQHVQNHVDQMWIKKPKIIMEYKDFL